MAFSLDDFSNFFDPISDVLGTSGRQGMGLLQQKPEDLQRAAMIAALVASGVGAAAAPGAAAGAAAGTVPAGLAPTLVTPSASILAAAPAAEAAAVVPGGITAATTDLAAEEAANLAAKEAVRNSIVNSNQLTPDVLASLEPTASGIQTVAGPADSTQLTNLEKLKQSQAYEANFVNNQASLRPDVYKGGNVFDYSGGDKALENQIELANKGSGYADYLKSDPYQGGGQYSYDFPDYQVDQARQAAAKGAKLSSGIDTSLGGNTVPDYTSFSDSFHKSSITPDRFQNLEGVRSMGADSTYKVGSGDYLGEGTGEAMKNPLLKGAEAAAKYFGKGVDLVTEYPKTSAAAAYIAAARAGLLDPAAVEAPKDNYKNPYTMTGFRRSSPNPTAYRYTPRYAEGGIASVHDYAKGKRVSSNAATDFTDFYDQMNARPAAPPMTHGDPGIYYDADPDTRYLDPMEASMVRMSKLNSRTNVQAPTMAPSRHMGELNFKPVAAAQGGIMGYADGGDVPIPDDEFNRLTRRGGGPRTKEDPGEKFNAQNVAIMSSSNPLTSLVGRYLTSPFSSSGIIGRMIDAPSMNDAHSAWSGINPEAMHRQEAQPERQQANINNLVSQVANEGAPPGPSAAEQQATRDNMGDSAMAQGGIAGYNLGGYAAGGNPRLLRGPGDGMSDHIPATINDRQPARLADGEYVITADVVSHLGNGSTEAGARQLDAMMKRIRKGRTGTPKQGKQIDPRKYLPA